jgi:hypothetical protein
MKDWIIEVCSFRLGISIDKENVCVQLHKNFHHHAVPLISILLLMSGISSTRSYYTSTMRVLYLNKNNHCALRYSLTT